jgi:hypothetical protein
VTAAVEPDGSALQDAISVTHQTIFADVLGYNAAAAAGPSA